MYATRGAPEAAGTQRRATQSAKTDLFFVSCNSCSCNKPKLRRETRNESTSGSVGVGPSHQIRPLSCVLLALPRAADASQTEAPTKICGRPKVLRPSPLPARDSSLTLPAATPQYDAPMPDVPAEAEPRDEQEHGHQLLAGDLRDLDDDRWGGGGWGSNTRARPCRPEFKPERCHCTASFRF